MRINLMIAIGLSLVVMACDAEAQTSGEITGWVCNGTKASWTEPNGTVHVTRDDAIDCCAPAKKIIDDLLAQMRTTRKALSMQDTINLGAVQTWYKAHYPAHCSG